MPFPSKIRQGPAHFSGLLLIILVFLHCLNCWPADARASGGTLTIGVLLDLSGPGSANGAAAFKAVRLAAEEVNIQGGIKGKQVQIAVFDPKGQKELLLSGARRLQHEQKARVLLGPTVPENILVLRRYAESGKIPLILIQGVEPLLKFTGLKTDWTFSTTLNFDAELKRLFSYFRKRHYEDLGALFNNDPSARKIALWIRGYAPEYSLKISCLGSFNPNREDLVLKLGHISRCEPDIAILWADWPVAALVQSNLPHIEVPVALSHQVFFSTPSALALPVGSLIYMAIPPVLYWEAVPRSSPSYFIARRFVESWGPEFLNMTPEQKLAAGQAWDGLRMACRAMSISQGLGHKAIRQSLEEKVAPFAGVTGLFSPDKRDHSRLSARSLLLLRCTGSRWSLIQ
jgi:hypothetical protein